MSERLRVGLASTGLLLLGALGWVHAGQAGSTPGSARAQGSSTWAALVPAGGNPPWCYAQSAVFDPVLDRMVVFGGRVGMNDVRELVFSGTPQWNLLAPAGSLPSGRIDHTAVRDPDRGRMLMFGGHDGSNRNDVWELSLSGAPAWNQLSPLGTPPGVRTDHVAIFDHAHDRMIVFGGISPTGFLNDVWELSFSGGPRWTALAPAGTPPVARQGHCAVWDSVRSRMIVFGGLGGGAYRNDVWALSLSGELRWTQLAPSGTPPIGRYASTAIYDPVGDRMIVFGGNYRPGADTVPLDDVWELSLSGGPAWAQLVPSGAPPRARWNHSAICDPTRGRMVIFAGENLPDIFSDTWTLSWGSPVDVAGSPVQRLHLGPPRPNPSHGPITFELELPAAGTVRLEVFDIHGRRVSRVVGGSAGAGRQLVTWQAKDDRGSPLRAGLYVIRLEAEAMSEARRVVLLP